MKDLKVTVTLKNNRLVKFREGLGFNQVQFAAALKIPLCQYGEIENLKRYPRNKRTGRWTLQAQKISQFMGTSPEDIFPEKLKEIKTRSFSNEIDCEKFIRLEKAPKELLSLPSPEEDFFKMEVHENISNMLKILTPTQEKIMRRLYAIGYERECTTEEVAKEFNISGCRVRAIVQNAIRRLQQPSITKYLRENLPELEWKGPHTPKLVEKNTEIEESHG